LLSLLSHSEDPRINILPVKHRFKMSLEVAKVSIRVHSFVEVLRTIMTFQFQTLVVVNDFKSVFRIFLSQLHNEGGKPGNLRQLKIIRIELWEQKMATRTIFSSMVLSACAADASCFLLTVSVSRTLGLSSTVLSVFAGISSFRLMTIVLTAIGFSMEVVVGCRAGGLDIGVNSGIGLEGSDSIDLSLSLPSTPALFRFVPLLDGV